MHVPSPEHDRVPYYELLLNDDHGNICIKKSFENYEIGDTIELDSIETGAHQAKKQEKIGIIGTGLMGKQLAQFFSQNGYSVILYSRTEEGSVKAIKKIEKGLSKTKDPQEIKIITNRIDPTNELSRLKDAELIVESVIEDMEIKKQLSSDLSSLCQKNAIIATNTSSLPITELATFVSNPERFIGCIFSIPFQRCI